MCNFSATGLTHGYANASFPNLQTPVIHATSLFIICKLLASHPSRNYIWYPTQYGNQLQQVIHAED
jgi:hypothetical protein